MTPEVLQLLRKIDAVRDRDRAVVMITGLLAAAGAFMGQLALFLALDWGFGLSVAARITLWAFMLAILAWVVWRRIVRRLRDTPSDDAMALRVEARHPDLGGRLIAVVQITRQDPDAGYIGSPELIAALEEDASRRALPLAFDEVINWRALRTAGIVAGAGILIAFAFTVAGGEVRNAFFVRLVGGDARYPTRTRIDRAAISARGEMGDPAWTLRGGRYTVDLLARGDLPAEGELVLRRPDLSRERFKLALVSREGETGRYLGVADQCFEPFRWSLRLGDDETDFRPAEPVRIEDRPRAAGVRVVIRYPAYTGRPEETSAAWEVKTVVGAKVSLQIRANKPLKRAEVAVVQEGRRIDPLPEPVSISPDGLEVSAGWTVLGSGSYRVRMTDRLGIEDADSETFSIAAVLDRAPVVQLLKPGRDLPVTTHAVVPVLYSVSDDFGVRSIRLGFRKASAKEAQYLDLYNPKEGEIRKDVSAQADLAATALSAQVGERITYWIEAADFHEPEANTGRSREFELNVLSDEEMAALLKALRQEILARLSGVREHETDALDEVNKVREKKE
jgi:hypothetical protein